MELRVRLRLRLPRLAKLDLIFLIVLRSFLHFWKARRFSSPLWCTCGAVRGIGIYNCKSRTCPSTHIHRLCPSKLHHASPSGDAHAPQRLSQNRISGAVLLRIWPCCDLYGQSVCSKPARSHAILIAPPSISHISHINPTPLAYWVAWQTLIMSKLRHSKWILCRL